MFTGCDYLTKYKQCIIAPAGFIMEEPPPSYEEALDIDTGTASSQKPPRVIPLATLHGNPSHLLPPQYHTVVQPTAPPCPAVIQHTDPQFPSAAGHEVATAQPTGTDLSRELNFQVCVNGE